MQFISHDWDPNAPTDPDWSAPDFPNLDAPPVDDFSDSFQLGDPQTPRQAADLKAVTGPLQGRVFKLHRQTTLGRRKNGNDVSLSDHAVSSHHAKICRENGRYVIQDLFSKNGTYVNERKITTHELQDQDTIRIGQSLFSFNLAPALD